MTTIRATTVLHLGSYDHGSAEGDTAPGLGFRTFSYTVQGDTLTLPGVATKLRTIIKARATGRSTATTCEAAGAT